MAKKNDELSKIKKRLDGVEATLGHIINTLEENAKIINYQHEAMKFIIDFAKSIQKVADNENGEKKVN